MALKLRTRLNVSPAGRGRIMLYFHESQKTFIEQDFIEEILQMKDCAIYYPDPEDQTDQKEQPDSIQMILILITAPLLEAADQVSAYLRKAREENIAVVPVLKEAVPVAQYENLFGQMHFLTWYQESNTQLPYKEKIAKALDQYLVTDEMRERIIRNFRKRIFLSYRKSDRDLARKMMVLLHGNEKIRDVAIWYDEMLDAGDEYNMAILDELKASDAFLLLTTPNVLKNADDGQPNYVERIEIPAAKEFEKEIIAVETSPLESGWKERLTLTDQQCVSPAEAADRCVAMLGAGRMTDMTPEEQYLTGLAYLDGILVEKNERYGMEYLETSANGGYVPAMKELKERFFSGNGLPRDHERSFYWLNKMIEDAEPMDAFCELEKSLQEYMELGDMGSVYRHIDRMTRLIRECEYENEIDAYFGGINEAKIWSYCGDAKMREDRMEEAVECLQKGCVGLEKLLVSMKNETNPMLLMALPVIEQLALDTLMINYDHYSEYLIKSGRREEAELILNKRSALMKAGDDLSGTDTDQDRNKFYEYVRRSEICQEKQDYSSAAECLEKALGAFDDGWSGTDDWEIMLDKAGVLNRLAGVYVNVPDFPQSPQKQKRVWDLAHQAQEIGERILSYDPDNAGALRNQSICLEVLGNLYRRQGRVDMMSALFYRCEKLREEIVKKVPSVIADSDLQMIQGLSRQIGFHLGTFHLSDKRTEDAFGNRCAVLYPDEATLELIHDIQTGFDLPVVAIKKVLRMIRERLIGEQYNTRLNNITAEILIGNETCYMDRSVVLYEVIDSAYRTHYVMFFSPETFEAKIMKLCEVLPDLIKLFDADGHLDLCVPVLKPLLSMLVSAHFGKIINEDDTLQSTPIFEADPFDLGHIGDAQFEKVADSDGYYCFCMMV